MSAPALAFQALTLHERIELFNGLRPDVKRQGGSGDGRGLHFFGSKHRISPKTFKSYGIGKSAAGAGARMPVQMLSQSVRQRAWFDEFQSCYREARNHPLLAPAEFALCDALWPVIDAVIADVYDFLARC